MTNCKDCPLEALDYDEDDAEAFMQCDKVGGELRSLCQCEDACSEEPLPSHFSKRKRKNRREKDLAYKRHLKTLHQNCTGYPSPVWYKDEIHIKGYGYIENPKPYYKRLYRGNGKKRGNPSGFFKKFSNRQVRRCKDGLHSGGSYKKVFDYWWTIT